jgi:hypothetical protein
MNDELRDRLDAVEDATGAGGGEELIVARRPAPDAPLVDQNGDPLPEDPDGLVVVVARETRTPDAKPGEGDRDR